MLYHFSIEFSDIDRAVYQTLDFRIAQHPSEAAPYLITRILAYALSYQEGLEFSPAGLGDPDAPAISALGVNGAIALWIEIGNPSARRLHKASKSAKKVVVYTYKNPETIIEEMRGEAVHRAAEIQIFSINPKFLQTLEPHLQKKNHWTILHQQGQLDIAIGAQTFTSEVVQHSLPT